MCNMEYKNTGYRIPKVNSTSRNIQKIIYYTFATLIWLKFLLFHAWCYVYVTLYIDKLSINSINKV